MDGATAVFAVVSLGVQLAAAVRQANDFLRSVHNAPDELIRLIEVLDQLYATLKHVQSLIDQQTSVAGLPGAIVSVASALQNCEKRVKKLESLVNGLKRSVDSQRRVQRVWAAFKSVLKKEEIIELRSQLYEDMMTLHLSISLNSAQLQLHHIQTSSEGLAPAKPTDEQRLLVAHASDPMNVSSYDDESPRPIIPKRDANVVSKETGSVGYHGLFGNVRFQKTSKLLSRSSKSHIIRKKAIAEETAITITPSFVRRAFEIRYIISLGRVSRTLNIYPTMKANSPIFMMCREGNLQGLQIALSNRTVSPYVMDQYGMTLLHYAASTFQTELCSLLLQLGVDPDKTATFGQKALHRVGLLGNGVKEMTSATEDIVNTLRILAQSQDDVTASDVSTFFAGYIGPPEGAALMLSLDMARYEILQGADDPASFPALAAALRAYGAGLTKWENFIRKLLRSGGVDVHAQVHRKRSDEELIAMFTSHYPCAISEPATPLDELFTWSQTPFEASEVAKGWLQMLSDEGYDILAYLKTEVELHLGQQQLSYPSTALTGYDNPRKLFFQLGPNPSVSWEWWIDPNLPAFLLRHELRHMDIFVRDWALFREPWEEYWPFTYPEWSIARAPYGDESTYLEWEKKSKRAGKRAERCMGKKIAKSARIHGTYRPSQMPGEWPV